MVVSFWQQHLIYLFLLPRVSITTGENPSASSPHCLLPPPSLPASLLSLCWFSLRHQQSPPFFSILPAIPFQIFFDHHLDGCYIIFPRRPLSTGRSCAVPGSLRFPLMRFHGDDTSRIQLTERDQKIPWTFFHRRPSAGATQGDDARSTLG